MIGRTILALGVASLLALPVSEGAARSPARASSLLSFRSHSLARSAALRATAADTAARSIDQGPTASALEQTAVFLNAELPELLLELARAYTPAGEAERKANVWSRGSYVVDSARVVEASLAGLYIETAVSQRGKPGTKLDVALVPWLGDAQPAGDDALIVELLRLANALDRPRDGATLLRLPFGSGSWALPENWRLNATPHPPAVRNRFFDEVFDALSAALRAPDCPSRLKVTVLPPELNSAMDVYRGATLLELIREVAIRLATGGPAPGAGVAGARAEAGRGLNVRVCVQGSMGQGVFTGLPLAISGLRKTMEMMDWQAQAGERFEGLLGDSGEAEGKPPGQRYEGTSSRAESAPPPSASPADAAALSGAPAPDAGTRQRGRVRFGAVEAGVVASDDDVVFVLAPQSMQGVCIIGPLQRLTEEAERAGAVVVLINPNLGDIPSAAGVMQVKGRGERIAFSRSFVECFAFRCLYYAGKFAFPIVGAMRFSLADAPFWTVYRRWEGAQCGRAGVDELYEPVAAYAAPSPAEGAATTAGCVRPLLCPPPPSDEVTAVLDPKMNPGGPRA